MVQWVWLTFRVQEWDDAQLAFGHIKRMLQVVPGIGILQLVEVNEVRPGDKSWAGKMEWPRSATYRTVAS